MVPKSAFGNECKLKMVPAPRLLRASSATAPALLYLLRPCSRALDPSGHLRSAAMFKFAPGELVEPMTIGLKVRF
jgi:hypothetical protein